jgi:hypothetical protein
MAQFPAYFAFKTFLTGGKGVILVKDQSALIEAEFQATPGSWKLFPHTHAGLVAGAKWAGVPVPSSPSGTGGETVPGSPKDALSELWHGLDLQQVMLRVGEVLLGLVLLGVGIAKLTGVDNVISNAAKTAGKAAMFA